jgi:chitinase
MSPIQPGVYCTPEWDPDPEHPPTKYYGRSYVRVTNLEPYDVNDPEISFEVRHDLDVQNNYGLIWTRKGDTITGRLVPERKLIKSNGQRSFALGINNPGGDPDPPPVSELLLDFFVNGKSASLPPDVDPPSKPENLTTVGSPGPRSVRINWDPSPELGVFYLVYVNDVVQQGHTDIASHGCTVTGLSPITTYKIRVQAVNIANKTSELSEPVTATTSEPIPAIDWDIRRAPFIDFTSTPTVKLTGYKAMSTVDGFMLGFGVVLADPSDTVLKWGGYKELYDTEEKIKIPADLSHGKWGKQSGELPDFLPEDGRFAISFGGALNYPLEKNLKDLDKIVVQYEEIIKNYTFEKYVCDHFDFDLEGDFIQNREALELHVQAMITLLRNNPKLQISYTLPVDAQPLVLEGFNPDGEWLLTRLAAAGIQPSLINGMLMEFGQYAPTDMWEACKVALEGSGQPDSKGMHKQIKTAWPEWDDAKVWRRIGACPMFGKNNNGKIFTLDHMRELVKYAREKNIGCVSGWDATRDYNGSKITGIPQEPFDFCKIIATYQPAAELKP